MSYNTLLINQVEKLLLYLHGFNKSSDMINRHTKDNPHVYVFLMFMHEAQYIIRLFAADKTLVSRDRIT